MALTDTYDTRRWHDAKDKQGQLHLRPKMAQHQRRIPTARSIGSDSSNGTTKQQESPTRLIEVKCPSTALKRLAYLYRRPNRQRSPPRWGGVHQQQHALVVPPLCRRLLGRAQRSRERRISVELQQSLNGIGKAGQICKGNAAGEAAGVAAMVAVRTAATVSAVGQ